MKEWFILFLLLSLSFGIVICAEEVSQVKHELTIAKQSKELMLEIMKKACAGVNI
jgi:hypothetical protein